MSAAAAGTANTDTSGLPVLYRTRVQPEWIDYNGHMSEAYYVLVFGFATDALLDAVGLDAAARQATGRSLYTVEARIRYLREVALDEPLSVETAVAAVDEKRAVVQHAMRSGDGSVVAETELLLLSVAAPGPRAAPHADATRAALDAMAAAAAGHFTPLPARRRLPGEAGQ